MVPCEIPKVTVSNITRDTIKINKLISIELKNFASEFITFRFFEVVNITEFNKM